MATFRTLELAINFNDAVTQFEIKGHLRDQLHRAASSIALNLAEGNAKFSVKEKKRFYQTAYGELFGSFTFQTDSIRHSNNSAYRILNTSLDTGYC